MHLHYLLPSRNADFTKIYPRLGANCAKALFHYSSLLRFCYLIQIIFKGLKEPFLNGCIPS